MYKGVVGVERVCCWRLSDGVEVEVEVGGGGGEDGMPRPRASHSLCWVGGRLVLFGGGCEGGEKICLSGNSLFVLLERGAGETVTFDFRDL